MTTQYDNIKVRKYAKDVIRRVKRQFEKETGKSIGYSDVIEAMIVVSAYSKDYKILDYIPNFEEAIDKLELRDSEK